MKNSIRKQITLQNGTKIVWDVFNTTDTSIEVRTQVDGNDVFLKYNNTDISHILPISGRYKMWISI